MVQVSTPETSPVKPVDTHMLAMSTLRRFSHLNRFRYAAANPYNYRRLATPIGEMSISEALRTIVAERGGMYDPGDQDLYHDAAVFTGEMGSRWLTATACRVVQSDPLQSRPYEIELEFGRMNCVGLPIKNVVILGLYGMNYDQADEFFAGTAFNHSTSSAAQQPDRRLAAQLRIVQLVAQATELLLTIPEPQSSPTTAHMPSAMLAPVGQIPLAAPARLA